MIFLDSLGDKFQVENIIAFTIAFAMGATLLLSYTVISCIVVEFMGLQTTKLLHLLCMLVVGREPKVMTNSIKHFMTFIADYTFEAKVLL